MSFNNKKYYSYDEALERAAKYCAYQERCHKEVKDKMYELGLNSEEQDQVVLYLLEHNYLNEERFAKQFVRGKFNIKQWGKIKIIQALKFKKVSAYCIKKGMQEINLDKYEEVLRLIIQKAWDTKKGKNQYDKKGKVAKSVIAKGFESGLVWEVLKEY